MQNCMHTYINYNTHRISVGSHTVNTHPVGVVPEAFNPNAGRWKGGGGEGGEREGGRGGEVVGEGEGELAQLAECLASIPEACSSSVQVVT